MQRTNLILGVALFVVAATLAVTSFLRKPAESVVAASDQAASRTQDSRWERSRSSAPGVALSSKRTVRRAPSPEQFSVNAPQSHPQSALLTEQARKVETESKAQLERLTKQLDLTADQRRKLFPILARTSKDYDPALTISGFQSGSSPLSGAVGNEELNQVLDPPQRDQLIEDAMGDQILWEEIIDKLRSRLDQEIPQISGEDPAAVGPPVATPPVRGNLFENIDPAK